MKHASYMEDHLHRIWAEEFEHFRRIIGTPVALAHLSRDYGVEEVTFRKRLIEQGISVEVPA